MNRHGEVSVEKKTHILVVDDEQYVTKLVERTLEDAGFVVTVANDAWIKLVRRTGLKGVRLHDARHTHASLMLKQGVHPKVVQERLGHASIQVTLDTYSHVAPGLQEAAANGFDKMVLSRRENEAVEKHY
jgi:integrase